MTDRARPRGFVEALAEAGLRFQMMTPEEAKLVAAATDAAKIKDAILRATKGTADRANEGESKDTREVEIAAAAQEETTAGLGKNMLVDGDKQEGALWEPIPAPHAIRRRKGRAVRLVPVISETSLIFYDETMLPDRLHACCPRFYVALRVTALICLMLYTLLICLIPAWGPFAVLEFTNTTRVLFSKNTTSFINSTLITSPQHPWAPAWSDACIAMNDISSIAYCLWFFDNLCNIHPGMFRRILRIYWLDITITMGTCIAYSVVAIWLEPHRSHVMWLISTKVLTLVQLTCFDEAMAVGSWLRWHPDTVRQFVGSYIDYSDAGLLLDKDDLPQLRLRRISATKKQTEKEKKKKKKGSRLSANIDGGEGEEKNSTNPAKKNSIWANLFHFFLLFQIMLDVARHYLLIFVSRDVNVFTISITNPFTGKDAALSNHQLASSLYWASLVFYAQLMLQKLFLRKMYRETNLLQTNFELQLLSDVSVFRTRQALHGMSSGQTSTSDSGTSHVSNPLHTRPQARKWQSATA